MSEKPILKIRHIQIYIQGNFISFANYICKYFSPKKPSKKTYLYIYSIKYPQILYTKL